MSPFETKYENISKVLFFYALLNSSIFFSTNYSKYLIRIIIKFGTSFYDYYRLLENKNYCFDYTLMFILMNNEDLQGHNFGFLVTFNERRDSIQNFLK